MATVTPFRQGELVTFTTMLCDGYVIEDVGAMDELVAIVREKAALHPGHHLLATLDDLDQSFYTSGHAIDKHRMDNIEGHDLSAVDRAVFKVGEHPGYLTTKSEFFIRRENFLKTVATATFAEVTGKLTWRRDERHLDFFALNARPGSVLDATIYLQIVPVARACDAVAAFPNGYFSPDLTPFEVHAVARHLEEKYGYGLLGIGASYVAFEPRMPLSEFSARSLAADLLKLHRDASGPALLGRVAKVIEQSPVLMLNYTDH